MPETNLEADTDPDAEENLGLVLVYTLYKNERSELLIIPVNVSGTQLKAMIDSGAQGSFVSKKVAKLLRNVIYNRVLSVAIHSVAGEIFQCRKSVQDSLLTYENGLISVEDLILARNKYDLILGITRLQDVNPVIDWKTHTLTFPRLPLPTLTPATPKPRPFAFSTNRNELNHCCVVHLTQITTLFASANRKSSCRPLYLLSSITFLRLPVELLEIFFQNDLLTIILTAP